MPQKGKLNMRKYYFMIMLLIIFLGSACSFPKAGLLSNTPQPLKEYTLEGDGKDKILLVSVTGLIADNRKKGLLTETPSLVEQVVAQLNKAQKDDRVKAVVFKINSPGGTITASDLLYHEILAFKEKTGAKIVVSMMDVAASGAYYMSLPADEIMAHPTTITGSVGVISIHPRVSALMEKIGLEVDVEKYGKHKDMGSPFRSSTIEERKLMQQAVNDFGERFISLVQKHRKLEAQALAEVSTARVFLADEALKLRLVDKIGYISDAVADARKIAGYPADSRVIVYRATEYPNDNYYNITGAESSNLHVSLINIDLPESLGLKAGLYYLWPSAADIAR
jgi:protease IV